MQWDSCYTVFQNDMKGLNSRLATCKIQSTNYIDQSSHCCSQTINSKHKSPWRNLTSVWFDSGLTMFLRWVCMAKLSLQRLTSKPKHTWVQSSAGSVLEGKSNMGSFLLVGVVLWWGDLGPPKTQSKTYMCGMMNSNKSCT